MPFPLCLVGVASLPTCWQFYFLYFSSMMKQNPLLRGGVALCWVEFLKIGTALFPICTCRLKWTRVPSVSCFLVPLLPRSSLEHERNSSIISRPIHHLKNLHKIELLALLHQCRLLEEFSSEASVACSACLVDFIDPIFESLSVGAVEDFYCSKH